MLKALSVAFLIGIGMVAGIAPSYAEAQPQLIGFELYSWPQGSRWQFAVFEGTTSARSPQEMRSKHNRLDIHRLKGRIASLAQGEHLYWRADKARGSVLPPKELVREINRYASTAGVLLLLPGQTPQDKDLENMQSDVEPFVSQ